MTFEEIIDQVANSSNLQKNTLEDGQMSCSYQEILTAFDNIDHHFAEREISIEDHLAFKCVNSVPGGLTLLYLLKKGYSFILLPPLCNRCEETGFELQIPKFCRHRVTIKSSSGQKPVEPHKHPENFLCIERNEQYNAEQAIKSSAGGKLYLRTSGSIGSPKMAVHSHSEFLGNVLNCVKRFRLESDDRIAVPVPIFHMYGLGAAFLPGIAVGASIDLQENVNILRYMERERQFMPNIAFLTPTLAEMLLKRRSPRAYKLVVAAGDKIKQETFLAFEPRFGRLLNLYGSTEMGAIATSDLDDPLEVRATTVAKPMPGVQIRLDQKSSEPGDEPTRVGKLHCRHAYGFAGYVDENGHKVSLGTLTQSGWFETGDLGRIQQGGQVEVLGRCDHSVNRSGFLVLFADIERAIETISDIERVIVVAQGESKRGQRIVAFCVPSQRATLGSNQIRTVCFDILPRYAIPDEVVVIDTLPTLPNGKVNRPALAEMATEG